MNADRRLVEAIRAKDAKRVRAAIAAGAKVTGLDGQRSALHLAAEAGDEQVIEALPRATVRKLLNELDAADRTPLMYAAAKGNVRTARALIEMGANVNARNSTGDTALRAAASDGTPEVAKLLLEAGGNPLLPGRLLLTPLDRARERHTPEGRMIAAVFMRWHEAKTTKKAQKPAGARRKSRPARRRRRIGVK
ncbi:MAG TPA: ankyrin repeat domain-containing protein [Tepidisphaeraceae bacterium]|jgi:ankyrin repeat protein|nr:ankyrin repeat domain-containing protein [Tepidisphaeraceae bacterium]